MAPTTAMATGWRRRWAEQPDEGSQDVALESREVLLIGLHQDQVALGDPQRGEGGRRLVAVQAGVQATSSRVTKAATRSSTSAATVPGTPMSALRPPPGGLRTPPAVSGPAVVAGRGS